MTLRAAIRLIGMFVPKSLTDSIGISEHMYHIIALGYDDEKINVFAQATLAKLLDDSLSGGDLTALALETGKFGVDVMALLDKANTETYGNPELEL